MDPEDEGCVVNRGAWGVSVKIEKREGYRLRRLWSHDGEKDDNLIDSPVKLISLIGLESTSLHPVVR